MTTTILRTLISTRAAEEGVRSNDTTGTGDTKQSSTETINRETEDIGRTRGHLDGESGQGTVLAVGRLRSVKFTLVTATLIFLMCKTSKE